MARSHRQIAVVMTIAMTTALAAMNMSARDRCVSVPLMFEVGAVTTFGYVFENHAPGTRIRIVDTPTDGGIRENVPPRYRERFEKWKAELLATEWGREQWNKYAENRSFVLTIVVSGNRDAGAGTDKYLWNNDGKLVGATITLSAALERGSPNPIYYPVLNSLSADTTAHAVGGPVIAATKLSHELGHVKQAAEGSMKLIQLQNELMVLYNSIFLENGLNARDKKLLDLAEQMNGTPVEIWESREYWSEVNAMLYLNERISKESFYCFVFKRIRRNIETHAKAYENRFFQHAEFNNSPCWN